MVTKALTHLMAVPPGRYGRDIDSSRAERAAADLLQSLGVHLADESLADTPRRMVAMYSELLSPRPFAPTTFPNDAGHDEQEFLSLTGGNRG